MCGRYQVLSEEDMIEIREIIEQVNQRYSGTGGMNMGEIYPTSIAPVVAADGARLMRWGFPK